MVGCGDAGGEDVDASGVLVLLDAWVIGGVVWEGAVRGGEDVLHNHGKQAFECEDEAVYLACDVACFGSPLEAVCDCTRDAD